MAVHDKKNTFGMAPFGELKGVADAALKIMTGQTQEVKKKKNQRLTRKNLKS